MYCPPPRCAYVPGIQLTEDALRAVLNVGLHHSSRLHRGGCNPIPFGRAAVLPVKRKRALLRALTRSPPLLPFSAECHPLSPSSVHSPLVEAVRHTPPGSSHRIVHPPTEPQLSRRGIAFFFFFYPPYRVFPPHSPTNAFTGGTYCMHASPVTRPSMFTSETASDLPESTLPSHCQSDFPTARSHLDFTDCH